MDALYFPSLSLPGAAWTNPNLLYFDRIGVIAPNGNERELFDGPTRILIASEAVMPIDPQRYALDDHGDDLVLAHLLGMATRQRIIEPITKIHLGKISFTSLPTELIRLGMLWRSSNSDWLEGPSWVVDYIMSVLATRMIAHPELRMSLVTDKSSASRVIVGTSESRRGTRRLQALAQLLPIGPDATVDDILKFRDAHRRELRQFRGLIEGLLLRSTDGPDGQTDFEARMRHAEDLRRHLIGQLDAVPSRNYLALTLSVASVAAPLAEHSFYSASLAVVGLGYLLCNQAQNLRRERGLMSNKLIYSALASKHFLKRSNQIL